MAIDELIEPIHDRPSTIRVATDTPATPAGRLELACAHCGYGAICRQAPPRCPMCGGETWDLAPWRPFRR